MLVRLQTQQLASISNIKQRVLPKSYCCFLERKEILNLDSPGAWANIIIPVISPPKVLLNSRVCVYTVLSPKGAHSVLALWHCSNKQD